MVILVTILIAISLSMDAFSLAIAYGTLNLNKKDINVLSLIVGIYHFIMPLIGMFIGNFLIKYLPINIDQLTFLVLFIIGIQMILESFKNSENVKKMNLIEMIIFGLAVSLDSFSVGIGLKSINYNYILSALIFSFTSFIFTYLGLLFGKKINELIGKISTLFGGITLIIIGICFLF